jgi:DNA-binding NarL/FixJ family response regulator
VKHTAGRVILRINAVGLKYCKQCRNQEISHPRGGKSYTSAQWHWLSNDLYNTIFGFGTILASPCCAESYEVKTLSTALEIAERDGRYARRWKMLRILIADDHEVARRGIRAVLESHPGWEVCGEARDGRESVELAAATKPDLVLLDIGMPNLNGLEAARQILATSPEIAILILTMHDSDNVVREVLRAGARGFLLKSDAGRDLVAAVEALQLQRTFFTTRVSQMVLDGFLDREKKGDSIRIEDSGEVLTSREREVIQLLAEGKTSKEVAVALNLSVKTAETHRTNLMRKLGLHSVADLTRYAVRNGIVQVF